MVALLLICLLLTGPVLGADQPQLEDLPDLQETPPPSAQSEMVEPEVTIIRRGRDIIEEYRVNGQLYMVKITPAVGYPYYFVDMDGDGNLETRSYGIPELTVPQWILFRW